MDHLGAVDDDTDDDADADDDKDEDDEDAAAVDAEFVFTYITCRFNPLCLYQVPRPLPLSFLKVSLTRAISSRCGFERGSPKAHTAVQSM